MKSYNKTKTFTTILLLTLIIFSCERKWDNPNDELGDAQGTQPVAAFTANKTTITEGESVSFTDQSTNTTTSWSWSFGDGGTSNSQNPSHTYSTEGTYNVSLTATNSFGSDTETKNDFVTVINETESVIDYDGNVYQTVQIGKQAWMAENLKTTHYADGTEIPIITDNTDWVDLDYNDDAYCYYNNDASGESDTYGALYTYAAAKDACPAGWHLPSDAEWTELKDYIADDGHSGIEGTALKATSGWYSNGNGTDDYGFFALPGGNRNGSSGTFYYVGSYGHWWSSTEGLSSGAWVRDLDYGYCNILSYNYGKANGYSVRCVRDN